MGKRGPKPSAPDGEARARHEVRLSPFEAAQIESVRAARGDRYDDDTLRALPRVWAEQQHLMRAGLDLLRGQLAPGEVGAVLDVLNGAGLLMGFDVEGGLPDVSMLGSHVTLSVADSPEIDEKWEIDHRALARKLAAAPLVARAALELWAAGLWARSDDDALWARERAWLAGEAPSWAAPAPIPTAAPTAPA